MQRLREAQDELPAVCVLWWHARLRDRGAVFERRFDPCGGDVPPVGDRGRGIGTRSGRTVYVDGRRRVVTLGLAPDAHRVAPLEDRIDPTIRLRIARARPSGGAPFSNHSLG